MKKVSLFIFSSLFFVPITSHAVLGVGDLTFDPTTYTQVVSLYEETVKLFDTANDSLKKLEEIDRTMKDAERSYQEISNFNLNKTIEGFRIGKKFSGADGRGKIYALRRELNSLKSSGKSMTGYYKRQERRLKRMEKLVEVEDESIKNVSKSTKNINKRTSGQITAQSTATSAALAAANDEREKRKEINEEGAKNYDKDQFRSSLKVYEKLGEL